MRIGIVCYPTYGGSGVVATELGKGLANEGHDIHIISYKQPARLDHFIANVRYHEVSFSNYPLFEFPPYETALASKLVDVARYEDLDIIHAHYAIPHASAAYLAKSILRTQGINMPVATTLHGTDITLVGKDATFAPVVAFSINQSDAVSAVSESLRRQTYEFFDVEDSRKIQVIPNFIDFNAFSRSNKEHFKKAIAPGGERILMHTSNFRKVKRIEDVIAVFKEVRNGMPSKLLLVGDGPERKKAEQLCRELQICGDVRFLGKQDAIGELLAVADLFLLPSESESFGLAALEAMACEVPVVSSDAGGIPEINIDGLTGYTCPIGDVAAMSKAALHILSDEAVLQKFRVAALQQAKKFDIDNVLPVYEDFYRETIARTGQRQAVLG